jgi:tetratricopeptide (TPR) repeat protein
VAQALLEKAISIDPSYGQALGVLAANLALGAYMGWAEMATTIPVAEDAALVAILADREDAWAHHALGCVYLLKRRFEDSLAEFEWALRLNPNFSLAQGIYGLTLAFCGNWEKADEAACRALRLSPRDPLSALYYGVASYAQFVGRNYHESMRLAQTAIRLRSDYVGGHLCSPLLQAWPDRPRSPLARSVSCAVLSQIFRLPGSRIKCRSKTTPTGNTMWQLFAGPAWTRLALIVRAGAEVRCTVAHLCRLTVMHKVVRYRRCCGRTG